MSDPREQIVNAVSKLNLLGVMQLNRHDRRKLAKLNGTRPLRGSNKPATNPKRHH